MDFNVLWNWKMKYENKIKRLWNDHRNRICFLQSKTEKKIKEFNFNLLIKWQEW